MLTALTFALLLQTPTCGGGRPCACDGGECRCVSQLSTCQLGCTADCRLNCSGAGDCRVDTSGATQFRCTNMGSCTGVVGPRSVLTISNSGSSDFRVGDGTVVDASGEQGDQSVTCAGRCLVYRGQGALAVMCNGVPNVMCATNLRGCGTSCDAGSFFDGGAAPDAGSMTDAGPVGATDAGPMPDGGSAGAPDSGASPDAGARPDGGAVPVSGVGGDGPELEQVLDVGCGCTGAPLPVFGLFLALALRRRSNRS